MMQKSDDERSALFETQKICSAPNRMTVTGNSEIENNGPPKISGIMMTSERAFQILLSFFPPGTRLYESDLDANLKLNDIPMLIRDFGSVLLRLERKCIIVQSKDGDFCEDSTIIADCQICASLHARLAKYFEKRLHDDSLASIYQKKSSASSAETIRVEKLRQDYCRISYKFVAFCDTILQRLRSIQSDHAVGKTRDAGASGVCRNSHLDRLNGEQPLVSDNDTKAANLYTSSQTDQSVDAFPKLCVNLQESNESNAKGLLNRAEPSTSSSNSQIRMLEAWSRPIEVEIKEQQLQDMKELQSCMENLKELQMRIAEGTARVQDDLDHAENTVEEVQQYSQSAVKQLVNAAGSRTHWWAFQGSGVGAVAGGAVAGIILGPLGLVAGLGIGGALGLVAGNSMGNKHKESLDTILKDSQADRPLKCEDAGNDSVDNN